MWLWAVKSPTETMKLIRSSETNESMQCAYEIFNAISLQVAWKIQEWKKINRVQFEGWSALRCENVYEGHHFLTCLAKPLIKHDV